MQLFNMYVAFKKICMRVCDVCRYFLRCMQLFDMYVGFLEIASMGAAQHRQPPANVLLYAHFNPIEFEGFGVAISATIAHKIETCQGINILILF